jgi:hypothetical protein
MSIKTLTEILGLSLELKDYEDRVQKRYDYIQEQLELDPEFVAYDYVEYWYGHSDIHYLFDRAIISTDGFFYKINKEGLITKTGEIGRKETYLRKCFHDPYKNTSTSFQTHRVVASTFIPKYEHLKDIPYWTLEVNHKDGNKHNPKINNLEWMTKSENTQHALENGLQKRGKENINSKAVIGRVTMEGPYKGMVFILSGRHEFISAGMNHFSTMSPSGDGVYRYGCFWETLLKEENNNNEFLKEYVEYFKANIKLANNKIKPICLEVLHGHYKGEKFYLYGSAQAKKYQFERNIVAAACKTGRTYKSCKWTYVSFHEISIHSTGIPDDVLATLK